MVKLNISSFDFLSMKSKYHVKRAAVVKGVI